MSELHREVPAPDAIETREGPARHGYWGPLPGETPELYRALGAPALQRIILTRLPEWFRAEFTMAAGRDTWRPFRPGIDPLPEQLTPTVRLERFVQFTKKNEAVHVLGFIGLNLLNIAGGEAIYHVAGGGQLGLWLGAGLATVLSAGNVAVNIPTIMVQRYNRLRAYRLLEKRRGR